MNGAVGTKDARVAASPSLLSAVRASAAAAPRAPAIRAAGATIEYETLLARAGAIARALRDAGVSADAVVALSGERTPETIAAVLAIVACGAAYLPVDLSFPETRIGAIIEDAQPRAALGAVALRQHLPSDTRWVEVADDARAALDRVDEGELAYVLFTSGSSGRPKGVAMRRGAVEPLIEWHRAHARLGVPARTLQFAPLGFDVSFQEIFSTLATGGTLVLPTEAERRDPYALLALLARERVERLFLPYVGLQALAEAAASGGDATPALRDVITAGEQLLVTPAIRKQFAALPGAVLHNHYGPTETHVVTAFELAGDPATWAERPPIGAPLPHVRVRVADASLADVADGSEGELLLGGECLAAGYIHRAELTAERFIEDAGARWYRTGDLVRRGQRGVLEYLGRADEQVKIDGFRVEPGEIEAVLHHHPAVAEVVVVAAESPAGRRLVAHIVPRNAQIDEAELASLLRAHAEAELAPYLVPHAFDIHAALPLTASGKIDRRALAAIGDAHALRWLDGAPLGDQIRSMWEQLIGVKSIDANDNLFERGARSLLVVRALTELRRHGHRLSAADVYEYPTIAAQTALLASGDAREPASAHAERARGDAQREAFARMRAQGRGGR